MRVHVSNLDSIPLSDEQITALLFSEDPVRPVDYVIVMGGYQQARADRAAELYWRGLTKKIIVTGGMVTGAPCPMSQAKFLASYLGQQGISTNDIFLEDQSQNTPENLKMSARFVGHQPTSLGLVTIPYHILRVRLTAAIVLPEHLVSVFPDSRLYIKDLWPSSEPWRQRVLGEVVKLAEYARKGDIQDSLLDLPGTAR